MGTSIYYTAYRKQPLSSKEENEINAAIARYAVEDQIEEYIGSGKGPNWELFCVYDPEDADEIDVVFEGATRLPDNSTQAMELGLVHWCKLLSEIRRLLPGATWDTTIDDYPLLWDEHRSEYDRSY